MNCVSRKVLGTCSQKLKEESDFASGRDASKILVSARLTSRLCNRRNDSSRAGFTLELHSSLFAEKSLVLAENFDAISAGFSSENRFSFRAALSFLRLGRS